MRTSIRQQLPIVQPQIDHEHARELQAISEVLDKMPQAIELVHADLVRPGQRTITKGDQRSRAITAASILAKVHRDGLMVELDAVHPGYGLAQHKGYPTPAHIEALHELGPSSIHRAAFAPVAAVIAARKER